jgi:hypothetical protein
MEKTYKWIHDEMTSGKGLRVNALPRAKAAESACHPELAKAEFARVYWHNGRYHYRSRRGLPMIVLGTALGSALFRAKLAIAKQAERAWHAYIERKIRETLRGSPR